MGNLAETVTSDLSMGSIGINGLSIRGYAHQFLLGDWIPTTIFDQQRLQPIQSLPFNLIPSKLDKKQRLITFLQPLQKLPNLLIPNTIIPKLHQFQAPRPCNGFTNLSKSFTRDLII